jgi:hypothetical protein
MNENIEQLTNEIRILLTSNDHQPESVAPLLGGKHHGELMPVCRRNMKIEIDDNLWRLYCLSFGNADILVYKHSTLNEEEIVSLYTAWAGGYKLEDEEQY